MDADLKEQSSGNRLLFISLVGPFFVFYVVQFLFSVSHSPYMLDDFSAPHERVNLSDPTYTRGLIWVGISRFMYHIPPSFAHIFVGVVHLLNAVLIAQLMRYLMRGNVKAYIIFLTSIFVSVNPITSDNLLWILAGYPVITEFFAICACLSLAFYLKSNKLSGSTCFIAFAALSYFTNEEGLFFLPLYALILYLVGGETGRFSTVREYLYSLLKLTALWIAPYISYRIFIYSFYGAASAVQPYQRDFDVSVILTTYLRMIQDVFKSTPTLLLTSVCVVLTIGIILFSTVRKMPVASSFTSIRTNSVYLVSLPIIVLIMLGPFSLLGGWLEYRFFYNASSLYIVLIVSLLWLLMYDFSRLLPLGFVNRMFRLGSAICLMMCGAFYTVDYFRSTLRPVIGIANYVNNFLQQDNKVFSTLPRGSQVFVYLEDPTYATPEYLFGGGALWALRAPWVPDGIVQSGLAPKDVNFYFVNSATDTSGTIVSIYNGSFDLNAFRQRANVGSNGLYVYEYAGEGLNKMKARRFVLTDAANHVLLRMPVR